MKQKTRRAEKMDRQRADLLLDPRRLRNDDPNHRRGGYGRDRSPRSRSRIYLISPRGTTVPRQRVRPTVILSPFVRPSFPLLLSSVPFSSPLFSSSTLVPSSSLPSRFVRSPTRSARPYARDTTRALLRPDHSRTNTLSPSRSAARK